MNALRTKHGITSKINNDKLTLQLDKGTSTI